MECKPFEELEQKASTGIVKNDHIHIRVGYVASLTGDRYTGSGQRGQEVSMPPAVRAVMDTTGWREREWTDGRTDAETKEA